jgi:hypothetical protein
MYRIASNSSHTQANTATLDTQAEAFWCTSWHTHVEFLMDYTQEEEHSVLKWADSKSTLPSNTVSN